MPTAARHAAARPSRGCARARHQAPPLHCAYHAYPPSDCARHCIAIASLTAALFPDNLEEIFALIRFGEGISATSAFLICPCANGRPVDVLLASTALVALPCYASAEWMSRISTPFPLSSTGADMVRH